MRSAQQGAGEDAGEDHEAAHGRRALLLDNVALRTVERIGWPLPCLRRSSDRGPAGGMTNNSAVTIAPPVRKVM